MIEGRPTFSPSDFEFYRDKGERERTGVNGGEAGPITKYTTDKEIQMRAARIGYNTAGGTNNAFLPEYVLKLERRIAELEEAPPNRLLELLERRVAELENATPPHQRKAERR